MFQFIITAPQRNNTTASTVEVESLLLTAVNNYRVSLGLMQLNEDQNLYDFAIAHSRQQATKGLFGQLLSPHQSLEKVMGYIPYYQEISENFAVVPTLDLEDSMQLAFNGFKSSPGHHQTMINPKYTHTAIGVASHRGYYSITQLFGEYRHA